MFIGQYEYSIDNKNRLFIPSKFRTGVRKFFVTRGLEGCLFMYTPNMWQEITAKFKKLPLTKTEARSFLRMLLSGAAECDVDRQGRILVPQNLCGWAKLKKNIIIVGVLDRFEIWSKEEWKLYSVKSLRSFTDSAEKLIDLGI
ncbi:MAG: division/cell wall cluster transcriptional repressor MraZ [bacterium]